MTTTAGQRPVPLADPTLLPVLDPAQAPWPGVEQTFGGVTLHVRRTEGPGPDAPTVVFVHGLGGSSTNWSDLAGQLAVRMNGVALDLPGFGRSRPLPTSDYSLAAHTDAVLCFLAGRGERVHLVGNSMGGAIALAVAARRPELVRTLTLVSPAVPDLRVDPKRLSDPRLVLALLPVVGKRARAQLATLTPRERAEQLMKLCLGDPSQVVEGRMVLLEAEYAERATLPWSGEALNRSFLGLVAAWLTGGSRSMWAVARRVAAPSLVVWGELDRLVSVRKAARTAAALERGRLLVLPGVGHIAQMEQPATVARAMLGMVDAVARDEW